jgi:hypothetical protein
MISSHRPGWIERHARRMLPFVLGAGAFAVAGVHTIAVARWAGQPFWAAVVITGTGEAMAVAAVLEFRHRRRTGASLFWPVLVTVAAFGFSAACNLTAALVPTHGGRLAGEPGAWRPVMAVWPVVAFALVTLMKATGGHGDDEAQPDMPAAPASAVAAADGVLGPAVDDSRGRGGEHAGTQVVRPRMSTPGQPARKRGQTRVPRRRQRTDEELLGVLDSVPAGTSLRQTATALGVGHQRARRVLTAAGRLPAPAPDMAEADGTAVTS